MRLTLSSAAQRKVIGPSAETQTCRKYTAGFRLCGRCVDAKVSARVSTGPAWQRGHRFGGQRFRVCAAAFTNNGAAACSRTGGRRLGFCDAFNGIVSRGRPPLKDHRPQRHGEEERL
jgi:hypothetical protein